MIRAVIVDDELKSRATLRTLLEDFCDNVTVVALCSTIEQALHSIQTHSPNVVFLDIQMHRETGFDLLTSLKEINFEVIFTTAHSEFALKAIKFSAIDYLLKPIDIQDLKTAVEKVEKRMNGDMSVRLEQFLHHFKQGGIQKGKIGLPCSDGLMFVPTDDIIYCEADGNYTNIYISDGRKYIVTKTLRDYEDLLHEHNFFRIHHSYLINLNCLKKYVKGDGGYVIMSNDVSLDVSKRRKDVFMKRIKQ